MAFASARVAELPAAGQVAIRSISDAGLGDIVHLPGSDLYEARTKSYWSLSPRLRPWAIVQPRSTEDVSVVMKALADGTDCQFAIRRLVNTINTHIDKRRTEVTSNTVGVICLGLEPAISALGSRSTSETWTKQLMIQLPRLHLFNLVEDGQTSTPHWRKVIGIHTSLSQISVANTRDQRE